MKIIKIESFEKEDIMVTVEGYPHARPIFNADITPTE
ncbi:unnamed protein product, partial [marine sediment metagenome]